jgi:hypothetical protein
MKIVRAISINVNPRERCTAEVTRLTQNHNLPAICAHFDSDIFGKILADYHGTSNCRLVEESARGSYQQTVAKKKQSIASKHLVSMIRSKT